MPNHVTNIIEFHCSKKVFQEIAEFIRKDDSFFGSVDFNKVLPMPPELDIEAGSRGDQGLKMYKEYLNRLALFTTPEDIRHLRQEYLDKVKDDPEIFELGEKYYWNLKKHGATTWYDWRINHWGTKWNAYDCVEVDPDAKYLQFNTAWSGVPDILSLLSEQFPDVQITYKWSDEDIGYNVGIATFLDGELKEYDSMPGGSKEAYELAAEVHDFDLAEWGYAFNEKTGTYEYVEENQYIADSPGYSDDAR